MNESKENRKPIRRFNKGFYIGLIVTILAQALVAVAIFLYESYVTRPGILDMPVFPESGYHMLSDMFMIPSIITVLIYCIMWVSKEGAFDAIAYSTKLVFYSIFAKNLRNTKLPATYGDYRLMKMAKERSSSLFLLFAAIPFLICGIVFTCMAPIA